MRHWHRHPLSKQYSVRLLAFHSIVILYTIVVHVYFSPSFCVFRMICPRGALLDNLLKPFPIFYFCFHFIANTLALCGGEKAAHQLMDILCVKMSAEQANCWNYYVNELYIFGYTFWMCASVYCTRIWLSFAMDHSVVRTPGQRQRRPTLLCYCAGNNTVEWGISLLL